MGNLRGGRSATKLVGKDNTYHLGLVYPVVDATHHRPIQILAKPDHTRPLDTCATTRALGELILGNVLDAVVRIQQRQHLSRRHVYRCRGQCRTERVVIVTTLEESAAGCRALDVEE